MEFRSLSNGAIGVTLLLLLTMRQTSAECVFGADNLARLLLRNATLVKLLNDTVFSYTSDATTAIKNISNFDVWLYLQTTYSLNAQNYLAFVTKGGLYGIDWNNATDIDRFKWDPSKNYFYNSGTKTWWNNETGVSYFPAHIYDSLVTPIEQALQNITTTYSFSYGIYRPSSVQMNYTGLGTSNGSTVLDPNCIAGSYFSLALPTDLSATVDVFDTYGAQFASFATMIDSTFDNFFRNRSSYLTNDFVRVNVISAYTTDGVNVTVDMEVYFINDTLEPDLVVNYIVTNLTKLQPMMFMNASGYSSAVSILSNAATNVTVNAYINAVPTTEAPTTTEPTTLEITTVPTTVPTTASSTTVPTTVPTTTTPTTLSSTLPTTLIPTTLSTSTTSTTMTTPRTTTPSTNATLPLTSLPTTVSSTTTAITTHASTTTSVTNSTTVASNSITNITSTNQPTNATLLASTTFSNNTLSATVVFASNTSLSKASSTSAVTSLSNTTGTPYRGNTSSVNYQNLTSTKVISATATGRQTTKASNTVIGTKGGAKYVPQGPSLMVSLTDTKYFYTITIPAITGLILSIIGCMALWQLDCAAKPKL